MLQWSTCLNIMFSSLFLIELYDYCLQSARVKALHMETGNHFMSFALLFNSPSVWMHMISNLKKATAEVASIPFTQLSGH